MNGAPENAHRLIESASALVEREMLPEARQALQSAREALARRGDAGPAHWCSASLVALEIAARDGDPREMEAEAARLHSLAGGGRYWMEQARARIASCAGRVDPDRQDRILAILAGEAAPEAAAPDPPAAAPALTPHPELRELPAAAPDPGTMADAAAGEWLDHAPALLGCATAAAPQADPPVVGLELDDLPAPIACGPGTRREIAALPVAPGARPRRAHSAARIGVLSASVSALLLAAWVSASSGVAHILPGGSAGEHAPRGEEAAHDQLLLGRTLLAAGDTLGAVAALAAAAQGDSRGTVAWTAAEALARLPGRAAPAADAYLLAFAAGLPAARAETVARAQELAGRPDRARRVREQAAIR